MTEPTCMGYSVNWRPSPGRATWACGVRRSRSQQVASGRSRGSAMLGTKSIVVALGAELPLRRCATASGS
eukprot:2398753-Pyramimonas_sp.AAC.1